MTLLYNLLLSGVDLAALRFFARKRTLRAWCRAMNASAVAAMLLAIVLGALGEDYFGVIRLACYGVFLHAVILLLASAVLSWPARRLLAAGCAAAAVGLLAIAIDAFLVEPTWLEVSRVRIESPKIGRPQKIVVLADLQTDRLTDYERGVFRLAMEEQPDVILLAGDYLEVPWPEREQLRAELNDFLREIRFGAPGGVFAVRGNLEADDWTRLFEGLGITTIERTSCIELDEFRLTCLSLRDSSDTSLRVPGGPPERFHIVLGHRPNFARGQIEADLLLAGHTHGGQVRLPWIGPLITLSRVPRAWAAGLTELRSGATLLVSRGIGMERGYAPRIRFRCRPQLLIVELVPAAADLSAAPPR